MNTQSEDNDLHNFTSFQYTLLKDLPDEDVIHLVMNKLKNITLQRCAEMTYDQAKKQEEFQFESEVIEKPFGKVLHFRALEYWIGNKRNKRRFRRVECSWLPRDIVMCVFLSERIARLSNSSELSKEVLVPKE
jgi:hypothetical protein